MIFFSRSTMPAPKSVSISPKSATSHTNNDMWVYHISRIYYFSFIFFSNLFTVTSIAEHNAEQEGKRNDGVKRRISLAIGRHAVCINQILKSSCKFVCPVKRRGIFIRMDHVEKRWYGTSALLLKNISHVLSFHASCITFWIIYYYDLQIVSQNKNITCFNKL